MDTSHLQNDGLIFHTQRTRNGSCNSSLGIRRRAVSSKGKFCKLEINGGVTARRFGGGGRGPFEVDSLHATPIGIMLNVENIAGDRPPPSSRRPSLKLEHQRDRETNARLGVETEENC